MGRADGRRYLFGFTEECGTAAMPTGALGEPRWEPIPNGSVSAWAIVSEPPEDWDEADAEDVRWLAPRALHHDEVLRSVVDHNVAPLRFGSLFTDQAALISACAHVVESLPRLFEQVRGRHEYRVSVQRQTGTTPRAASGTDYLRRRQRELSVEDETAEQLLELSENHATESVPAEGRPGEAVVDVLADRAQLEGLVAALQSAGYSIAIDGPLPPYHFMALETPVETPEP